MESAWKVRRLHAMIERSVMAWGAPEAGTPPGMDMSRPRAIIAADEPLLREELAELLASLWPELEIVALTGDGIATLRALEQHAPEVMFLDIQMPGMTVRSEARSRRATLTIPLSPLAAAVPAA